MTHRFLVPFIFALAFAAASGVQAGDGKKPVLINPAPVYKDLPGVVPERDRVAREQADEPNCTTGFSYQRWRRGDIFDHGIPVQVYRCEQNGFTYSGTEMPNRPWVPGLNPHFLPAQ